MSDDENTEAWAEGPEFIRGRFAGLNIEVTMRDCYVFAMVALGRSNDEIAEALSCSRRQAANYVGRLMDLTSTRTRQALITEVLSGCEVIEEAETWLHEKYWS